jgi:hypothetical protein
VQPAVAGGGTDGDGDDDGGDDGGVVVAPPQADGPSSQAARRIIQVRITCTWPDQVDAVSVMNGPTIRLVRLGHRWKLRWAAAVSGALSASTRALSDASDSRPPRSACQRAFSSFWKAGSVSRIWNQSLACGERVCWCCQPAVCSLPKKPPVPKVRS